MSSPIQLDQSQLAHMNKCVARVNAEIDENGGSIYFDEYMHLVLHDPEIGYYQNKTEIIGKDGDFTTVPETSVHLAYCLAHACAKLIYDDAKRTILEIGAGSGKLACDLLSNLATWKQLPSKYYIYEPSEALRNKQKKYIENNYADFLSTIEWLPDLSCDLDTTIIIANEVIDALPVKCFTNTENGLMERTVIKSPSDGFTWQLNDPTHELDAAIDYLTVMLNDPMQNGYCSELNLKLEETLSTWANCCQQCVMFIIDYGYPSNEYYHAQRSMGTLRSYFKHQFLDNPFQYPGLQDITADVDFTSIARTASYLGMGVLSFTSQRNFMLANHLLEWQPVGNDEVEHVAQIAQLKQLTLGSAISERFQVMVLGQGIDYGADRFTMRDMRSRL